MPLPSVNKHREQRYGTFGVTYPVIEKALFSFPATYPSGKLFAIAP